MDVRHELHGLTFIWNAAKATANARTRDAVTFEQAATVFFDPFFRLVDASRAEEAREAVIGYDATGRLLFVVHVEVEGEALRIVSARWATNEERRSYEHS